MNRVDGYGGINNYYSNSIQKQQKPEEDVKAKKAQESEAPEQPKLSDKAQALLDKLKKKYDNMDFMVAENTDDAKSILSRGTKEYSVLFSASELEKMAEDEDVEKEYISKLENATDEKEGLASLLGDDKNNVSRIGISFNADGTTSYFAELEKTSEKQQERIEKAREKRADEKKAAEKTAADKKNAEKLEETYGEKPSVKRTTVEASTKEELLQKIADVDWDKVSEIDAAEGSRFDFTI